MSKNTITGNVKKIIFKSKVSSFTIASLKTEEGEKTIVGGLTGLDEGTDILAQGSWKTNARYGEQFAITSFKCLGTPSSDESEGYETVVGEVSRIRFKNEENGYAIMLVTVLETKREITVVGEMPLIRETDTVEFKGEWKDNARHGKQLVVTSALTQLPNSEDGIRKFLSSGAVNGVGKVFANKIVDAFGAETLNVISNNPEKLYSIKGVGKKRVDSLIASWFDREKESEAMSFLQGHSLGGGRASAVYEKYGFDTIKKTAENPYIISYIKGIGFKIADTMAMSIGIPADSPMRARSGLIYILNEMTTEGHCFTYRDDLIKKAYDILEISETTIDKELTATLKQQYNDSYFKGKGEDGSEESMKADIISETDEDGREMIYSKWSYYWETTAAKDVKRIARGSVPWKGINFDVEIKKSEKLKEIELSDHQKSAIVNALTSKFSVVTGGPGVGKTTVLNVLLDVAKRAGCTIQMCAPTGKAAKRMTEATGAGKGSGLDEALTIHRLLEYSGETNAFKRDKHNPLACDLLVIDESSMMDLRLAFCVFQAVSNGTAVIMIGDVDQLPSVGAGNILNDIINSGITSVSRLTEIFRQAASSQIIVNAHLMNSGKKLNTANDEGTDFLFIHADTPEAIEEQIVSIVTEKAPAKFGLDARKDIQVLTPMKDRAAGVKQINERLQRKLNPESPNKVEIKNFDVTYREGDKVIQTANNYNLDIVNGDVGFIVKIDLVTKDILVQFDGKDCITAIDKSDISGLQLAYAMTIHKSQGSEYPCVVIPVTTSHYRMLERNLYYTGITRGKKLVVMVGQTRALETAARTVKAKKRNTRLSYRIAA